MVALFGALVVAVPAAPAAAPVVSASGPTVAIGDHHTIVVRTDGSVWTWGLNRSGQLGVSANFGTDALVMTPQQVSGLGPAVAVAAGAEFSVVLLADGSVWTFGANDLGQLGSAAPVRRSTPERVTGMGRVISITAGAAFAVAADSDGDVWGFGSNAYGQLGLPLPARRTDAHPTPRLVGGLEGVVRVAAGADHLVALTKAGMVSTLGLNADGQLGRALNFRTYESTPLPVAIAQPSVAVAIVAGRQHTLVLGADRTTWTFGRNAYGELGTATDLFWRRYEPRAVPGFGEGAAMAAGTSHTVVVGTDGVVRGVGGRVAGYVTTPASFPALDLAVGVAAGPIETLVTRADGSLWRVMFPAVVPPGPPELVFSDVMAPAPPVAPPPDYHGFSPVRLLETRPGATPTVDGRFSNGGALAANSVTQLAVTGRAGIAMEARAVVLNVTVTGPRSDGYVSVYPCDAGPPNASNLNFVAGDTIPNAVVAKLSATGSVCIFTTAETHMTVDAAGVYPAGASFVSLSPARLLETRPRAAPTVDGRFSNGGALAAGSVTELVIATRGGVPAGALAAALNVTITEAVGEGYVTLYPCDATRPNASHLNFSARQTIANAAIVKLSATGSVCVFTTATTQMTVDVNGVYPAGSSFVPLAPARVFETRVGATPTVDGQFSNRGVLAAGSTTQLQLTGRAGVPAGALAVVLNVTVVGARSAGYTTVYPCDAPQPNASNLNFVAGRTIPNMVIARPSATGAVCLFTTAPVDMLVDVNGYQPG